MSSPDVSEAAPAPVDRSHWFVRKGNMHDPSFECSGPLTAEERLAMVWPVTVQAWAFRGIDVASVPMARDVVRVIRRMRSQPD